MRIAAAILPNSTIAEARNSDVGLMDSRRVALPEQVAPLQRGRLLPALAARSRLLVLCETLSKHAAHFDEGATS